MTTEGETNNAGLPPSTAEVDRLIEEFSDALEKLGVKALVLTVQPDLFDDNSGAVKLTERALARMNDFLAPGYVVFPLADDHDATG